jgi:RNA polymerase sigma factor (sigma-70 family)
MTLSRRSQVANDLADKITPGDERAFTDLTDFLSGEMRRYAYHMLPSISETRNEDADDITQATVARAWVAYQASEIEPGNIRAWMMTSIRNRCIDLIRRRKRWRMESWDAPTHDGLLSDNDQGALDQMVEHEDAVRVRRALAMTSPRHRLALVLREYHEMPLEEIGRCLGRDDGGRQMMKSLLFRARDELRQHYLALLDQERLARAG